MSFIMLVSQPLVEAASCLFCEKKKRTSPPIGSSHMA